MEHILGLLTTETAGTGTKTYLGHAKSMSWLVDSRDSGHRSKDKPRTHIQCALGLRTVEIGWRNLKAAQKMHGAYPGLADNGDSRGRCKDKPRTHILCALGWWTAEMAVGRQKTSPGHAQDVSWVYRWQRWQLAGKRASGG